MGCALSTDCCEDEAVAVTLEGPPKRGGLEQTESKMRLTKVGNQPHRQQLTYSLYLVPATTDGQLKTVVIVCVRVYQCLCVWDCGDHHVAAALLTFKCLGLSSDSPCLTLYVSHMD